DRLAADMAPAGLRDWQKGFARTEKGLIEAVAGLKANPPRDEDNVLLDPPDAPRALGRIGAYQVHEHIGAGAMGVVFKAFDPALHRFVALKAMRPSLARHGVARARFQREARAAAAVDHEHVVAIHAVEEWRGSPFLVMHWVKGPSLQERLQRQGPFDIKEALR